MAREDALVVSLVDDQMLEELDLLTEMMAAVRTHDRPLSGGEIDAIVAAPR